MYGCSDKMEVTDKMDVILFGAEELEVEVHPHKDDPELCCLVLTEPKSRDYITLHFNVLPEIADFIHKLRKALTEV